MRATIGRTLFTRRVFFEPIIFLRIQLIMWTDLRGVRHKTGAGRAQAGSRECSPRLRWFALPVRLFTMKTALVRIFALSMGLALSIPAARAESARAPAFTGPNGEMAEVFTLTNPHGLR